MLKALPNKSLHPTATRLDASGCREIFGRRIVCRCSIPVAVGELKRWVRMIGPWLAAPRDALGGQCGRISV